MTSRANAAANYYQAIKIIKILHYGISVKIILKNYTYSHNSIK
jgi:hypothetical protein